MSDAPAPAAPAAVQGAVPQERLFRGRLCNARARGGAGGGGAQGASPAHLRVRRGERTDIEGQRGGKGVAEGRGDLARDSRFPWPYMRAVDSSELFREAAISTWVAESESSNRAD